MEQPHGIGHLRARRFLQQIALRFCSKRLAHVLGGCIHRKNEDASPGISTTLPLLLRNFPVTSVTATVLACTGSPMRFFALTPLPHLHAPILQRHRAPPHASPPCVNRYLQLQSNLRDIEAVGTSIVLTHNDAFQQQEPKTAIEPDEPMSWRSPETADV
jgi:hypothetical protein